MKTQKRILSLIMSMVMVISTFVGYAANIKYVKAEAADTMDITWHFQNASEWELVGGWLYEGNAFTTNVSPADKCIVKTLEELVDEDTGETYENVKQVWPGAAMDNEGGSNSSWYKVTATYTDPSASGVVSIFNNYAADNWTNDTTTQADLDNIKANAIDGKIKVNTIADDAADEVKTYWADVPSSCFAAKEQTANIVISARAIKSVDGTITDIYCTNDGTTVTCYAKTDSGKLYQVAGNKANEVESVPDYNEGGEDETTTEDETSTSDETTEETTEEETTEKQKNPDSISENIEEGEVVYSLGSAMAPVAWNPDHVDNAFVETKWDNVVKANISVPAKYTGKVTTNEDGTNNYEEVGEWTYRFGIIAQTADTVTGWNRMLIGTDVAPEVTDTTSNCLSNIRVPLEEEAYTATVYLDTATGAVAIYKNGDNESVSYPTDKVDYTFSWVGNDNDETYYAPADYAQFATVGDYEATLSAAADRTADLEKCGYTADSALPNFVDVNNALETKLNNVADAVSGTEDTIYTLGSAMAPVAWAPQNLNNAFEETKWDGVVKANISVPAATDEEGNPAGEWTYRFGIIATTDNTVNAWNRALVGTTVAPETTDTTSNCLTNIRPALEEEAYEAVVYYDTTTGAVAIYKTGDDTDDTDSTPDGLVDITMSWVGNDNDETYYAPADYAQFATVGDYEATLSAKDDRTADLEKCGYTSESALPDFATLNAALNEKLTTVKSAQDVAYEENTTVYTIGAAMAKTPWAPTSMNNAFEETKWDGVVKANISVPAATDEEGNPAGEWTYRFGIIAHTPETTSAWNRQLLGTSVSPEATDTTSNCLTNIRPELEEEAYTATVYYDTTTGAVLIFKTDDADGVLGLPDELVNYTMSWVGNDNDETYYAPADYAQFATVGDYEDTLNAKEDRTADLEKCGYTSESKLPNFVKGNLALAEKILGNFKITTDKDEITLSIGETDKIDAKIEPETLADTGITVTVEGDSATYDEETGTVTAVKAGDTTITFTNSYDSTISKTVNVHVKEISNLSVNYKVQVQKTGWEKEYVSNGTTSGTVGQALRLEAIKIKLVNSDGTDFDTANGSIEYRVHVQKNGWEKEYRANDELSGTVGEAKRLEAIQIKLTGTVANYYDVAYRVQAQKFGWLGWAMNDEESGTAGYAYRLEGIQIILVKKGEEIPSNVGGVADTGRDAFYGKSELPVVMYRTQVQTYGWQDYVKTGATSGTVGKAKRLEAIRIKISNNRGVSGDIEYRTHVQKKGWQKFVKNDALSGTVGKALRLEAIQIRFTGDLAEKFDIYYRVQAQKFGWMGWAKNGESAGTSGYGYRLEAIQIEVAKKGTPSGVIGTTKNAYRKK